MKPLKRYKTPETKKELSMLKEPKNFRKQKQFINKLKLDINSMMAKKPKKNVGKKLLLRD